ncbi:MAG: YdcF family protein [Chloroflexota bacterium]
MFIYLSKLLPLFIYPLGFASMLILGALVWRRHKRLTKTMLMLALAALWLGGNRWVSKGIAYSLESRFAPLTTLPEADAIIVLGGGTETLLPPRQIYELNASGDRMLYAAWLYQQAVSDVVVVSGGSNPPVPPNQGLTEAEGMQAILEIMGVPKDAVWLEWESRNTYQNAVFVQEMLSEADKMEIVLVTSAVHMRRSVALFEKQGFTVIPAPTDYRSTDKDWELFQTADPFTHFFYFFPASDNLDLTSWALKEYIGKLVNGEFSCLYWNTLFFENF